MDNNAILERLSKLCAGSGFRNYLVEIRQLREQYDTTIGDRPLEVEVLSRREIFPKDVLYNLYTAFEDVEFFNTATKVLTFYAEDSSMDVYLATLAEVCHTRVDDQSAIDMVNFITKADLDLDATGIKIGMEFFQRKRTTDYAPLPSYIGDYEIDPEQLPQLKNVEPHLMSTEQIVEYIFQTLQPYSTTESNDIVQLETSIREMSDAERLEKFEMLSKITDDQIVAIREDKNVFRVYGPVNPSTTIDFSEIDSEDVNIIYGGERMFSDNSMEYDYDHDEEREDWFTGKCQQCQTNIRAYFHAVRLPFPTGGWMGCYCSCDCIRKTVVPDVEDEVPEEELAELQLQVNMINELQHQLEEIGVADRSYDQEEEESA